jgi:hypothetical protein
MPLGVRDGRCDFPDFRFGLIELAHRRNGCRLGESRQEGCVMQKAALVIAAMCVGLVTVGCASDPRADAYRGTNVLPIKGGVVADELTAKRMADAVISSIYGPQAVAARAYRLDAHLEDGVWTVQTEPLEEHGRLYAGGTVEVKIRQSNGTVIKIAGNQ